MLYRLNDWYRLGLPAACVFSVACLLPGCAVIEPEDADRRLVASRIEQDPDVPIEQLSREIGISHTAVIDALPKSFRAKVPRDQVPALLEDMANWGPVEVQFKVIGHELTYRGNLPGIAHRTPNVIELDGQGDGLSMSIATREIASVWLVQVPFTKANDGLVVFCEELGEPWMEVRVKEKDPGFNRAWERYAK